MKNVAAFFAVCKQAIAQHANGSLELHAAAAKIYNQANDHPFEADAHPMLYEVADISFDIIEDYRSPSVDTADWNNIVRTINAYTTGNWEPTCWILSAMYGEYADGKLVHSFSVAVRRQNGETSIETAVAPLQSAFAHVLTTLNIEQTDERYLQNLATLAPSTIAEYTFASVEVAEYLTKPYYPMV